MADMKINNVGAGRGPSSARKSKKASAGGSSFSDSLREAAETSESSNASSVAGMVPMGNLLSVQEVNDSTSQRSRGLMIMHGEDMLDRLDDIRIGILNGTISKDKLADLAHKMRQQQKDTDDPKLKEIIEEIELRTEVEIAKLTRDRG